MARGTNTKTAPATISAKERAAEALRLRKSGCGFSEIARLVGYHSRQAAHDAVRRAIREIIKEPVEDLVALDVERLDALWKSQFPAAQAGDPDAVGCCLKILEKRWRLLGMDSPRSQESAASPQQTVMVVPYFSSPAEWEAVAQQAQLKKAVRE